MSGRLRLVEREPGVDLGVGAVVVYGGHGVGRVAARSSKNDIEETRDTVVLEFRSGLSVILPLERAEACLRQPAGASELEAVSAALRVRDAPIEHSWQARTRSARAKIALGDPVALAEVVRDAVQRQRRLTPGSTLSSVEQTLYTKARSLLAAELAVAAGIDDAGADTWIDGRLDRDLLPRAHA